MRGMELIMEILERNGIAEESIARKVHDEKDRVFRSNRKSVPFEGAPELVDRITCPKAVVSGSAKADVETILHEAFGRPKFSVVITADDVKVGKPQPSAFIEAARRLGTLPQETLVIENAPLGVVAAGRAGMQCYVALNSTPLGISDFDRVEQDRIFETTGSLTSILVAMCS
jgi:HAD superfamily hydrolase (TIGR01509 family)